MRSSAVLGLSSEPNAEFGSNFRAFPRFLRGFKNLMIVKKERRESRGLRRKKELFAKEPRNRGNPVNTQGNRVFWGRNEARKPTRTVHNGGNALLPYGNCHETRT